MRHAGVKSIPTLYKLTTQPLGVKANTLSPEQLHAGIVQHYDLSSLLENIPDQPISGIQNLNKALKYAGFSLSLNGDFKKQYETLAEFIINLAQYNLAPWWDKIKDTVTKLNSNQRYILAEELGLIHANEYNLSDTDILFRLSHGAPPIPTYSAEDYANLSEEAIAALTTRYSTNPITYTGKRSPLEPIIFALDNLDGPELISAASQYGIRLPIINPRETLFNTIFLYEWVDHNRDPITLALPRTTNLVTTLRKYDDFELMSVWPGFAINSPKGRRSLLTTLLQELDKYHYFPCGYGLAYGTYINNQCYDWANFMPVSDDRNSLMQLVRACTRLLPDGYAKIKLNETIMYLIQAWQLPELTEQPQETYAYILGLFKLGMVAFGWIGEGPYPTERKIHQSDLLTSSLEALKGLPEIDLQLIKLDDTAMPVLLNLTTKDINDTNVVENAIYLVQSAFYYMLIYYNQLLTDVNPFIYD